MAIWKLERNDTNEVIELHKQYIWTDEYKWTPLVQSDPVFTLSGSMDVQQGTRQAGRPITLDCTYARISRNTIMTLQSWSSVPELMLTLTHPDGRIFTVIFDRPSLTEITPIKPIRPSDAAPDDLYRTNVHLITV